MQIEFSVHGDRLEVTGRNEAYTGNVNTYTCVFRFSKHWNGFSPIAVFAVGGEYITTSVTGGTCNLPAEALLERKSIRVGVYGIKGQNEADYQRLSTNWTPPFYIREGAYCQGTAPEEPTPDLWEQYVTKMQEAIDNGSPQIGENGNWFLWSAEAGEYQDSGKPSRGIQGPAGPQGEKGDTPQKGVDYFTEADIESLGLDGKADKANTDGGFAAGNGSTTMPGGAIGRNATSVAGGAVGLNAKSVGGGAIGNDSASEAGGAAGTSSKTENGGAIGAGAKSIDGGAIGCNAVAADGFAGGLNAKTINDRGVEIDAVQLGSGTNKMIKTLQVYNHTLMNADGTIPAGRIPQLDSKADKAHVYTKSESDMRYLPKGTAAGYPVTVSDHLESVELIDYRIQGNTKQETVGKNLFDIDEITPKAGMTKNGTQIIFAAETYAHVFKNMSLYKRLLPNTTYTISTVYTGQGVEPTAAGSIRLAKPTGETFTLLEHDAAAYTDEYRTDTFTTPADIAEYVWTYLYASRTTSVTTYDKIQIELGETATDYEPYHAPQGVGDLVSEGEQAGKYKIPLVCQGRNWLYEAYFKERSNLTADASSYYGAQIQLLPNTQYTFSRKDSAGYNAKVNNRNVYAKIIAGGTSYLFMHTTSQANNRQTFTFTTGADGLITFSFYPCFNQTECNGFWDLLGWCQLELGAAQTAYEAYTADTVDIYLDAPLQSGESASCTADNLPRLTALDSGTMTITAQTAVEPSEIGIQYYQDINKKILELQNAIIAGGTANV